MALHSAPWNYIKGELKRALVTWNECSFSNPDDAGQALCARIQPNIRKHVPETAPMKSASAPWWNHHSKKSFKLKTKTFKTRSEFPERYLGATHLSKQTQRKSFKECNVKIKTRLDEMSTADSNFWSLIKELSGLSSSRSSSAPSVRRPCWWFRRENVKWQGWGRSQFHSKYQCTMFHLEFQDHKETSQEITQKARPFKVCQWPRTSSSLSQGVCWHPHNLSYSPLQTHCQEIHNPDQADQPNAISLCNTRGCYLGVCAGLFLG